MNKKYMKQREKDTTNGNKQRTRIKQKEAECQIQPHLKRHIQRKITLLSFLAICGQSYKHFTIVNYDSRVRLATDWLEQNSLKRA